jgi:F420H(2)-dependent quinone reductase
MPLTGEYEPSAFAWARDQVDLYDYQAREVHDAEYADWWERAVAAWPDYAEYQKKTTRKIPVFVLTPTDA